MLLLLLTACVIDADHYRALADAIATGDRDQDGHADASEGGDDCDDLDPLVHPGADETWADGFTDNDCDGEQEVITVEFGADALTGASPGASAGRCLATLGDVSGDGLDELLIGAWSDGSAYDHGGAAHLVTGARDGTLADHPTVSGSGAYWYLGCGLDGGPDLDGDGAPDAVIGALGVEEYTGAAWLVSGADWAEGALELPRDAISEISGVAVGAVTGSSARFLGDVTGDGVVELAVSAQLTTVGGLVNAGAVGLFSVDALGDTTMDDASITIRGSYADAVIGASLAWAGDQDGDGLDDYLIGADGGLLAAILPGGAIDPDIEADAITRLTAASEDVRESAEVRIIGDVDGDGTPDLAAVPLSAGGADLPPQVLIYTALAGTPTRTTANPSAVIDVGEASFVFDVANAGDLDGDGRDETLVPVAEYGPLATGVVALHLGDTLGFHAALDVLDAPLLGVSVRPAAKFGYRARVTADLDGDGAGEIVLGGAGDDEAGEDAGAVTLISLPR